MAVSRECMDTSTINCKRAKENAARVSNLLTDVTEDKLGISRKKGTQRLVTNKYIHSVHLRKIRSEQTDQCCS